MRRSRPPWRGAVRPHVCVQGAAGRRPHPRDEDRRGRGGAAVRAAGGERACPQGADVGGGERPAQPGPRPWSLWVSEIYVDEGPSAKRIRPRAQGRAYRVLSAPATSPSWSPSATYRRPRRRRPRGHQERASQEHVHAEEHARQADERSPRREGPDSGPEGQPARVPVGDHHRLQEPVVRRQALQGLRGRGRRDPATHVQGSRARRHLQGRDRAHPRAGPGGHPHGPPGHRDRPQGCRGRPHPQRSREAHRQAGAAQHPRGQGPRDRRAARRPGRRGAAHQPRRVPPRHAQVDPDRDALRRQGHPGAVLRPPRRRGDVALGVLPRGPGPAAHAAGRHRLRLLRGEDDVRPHRREGLDLQGRRVRLPGRARGAAGRRSGPGGPGPRRPRPRRLAPSVARPPADAPRAPVRTLRPPRRPRLPAATSTERRADAEAAPTDAGAPATQEG